MKRKAIIYVSMLYFVHSVIAMDMDKQAWQSELATMESEEPSLDALLAQLSERTPLRSRRQVDEEKDDNEKRRKHVRVALHIYEFTTKNPGLPFVCRKGDSSPMKIFVNKTRWTSEAMSVVQMANHLTSLWRLDNPNGRSVLLDDEIFYGMVRTNVLYSKNIFGSAICFDGEVYKGYKRFCPYGFRDDKLNGIPHVKDLNGTNYLDPDRNNLWWIQGKNQTLKLNISDFMVTEFRTISWNSTETKEAPFVSFDKDFWTVPYFDCVGGKQWMFSYVAPFFNKSNNFMGMVTMDVRLSDVDINQCDPSDEVFTAFPFFTGTHLCKNTTLCEPIVGQGFKRGMYKCVCKRGYYFNGTGKDKFFSGEVMENEHDLHWGKNGSTKWMQSEIFQCLKCRVGCDECVDDSPCLYSTNQMHRISLLVLNQIVMCAALTAGGLVIWKKKEKAIRGASPVFLLYAIAGSTLMYIEVVIIYFPPEKYLCVMRDWVFHMGFALTFGSLILKTWRISVIFQVRSAKKIELTDTLLSKRLLVVLGFFTAYLLIWTLTMPTTIKDGLTPDNLKYKTCTYNLFEYIIMAGEFLFLMWGMYLCYRVRNAPSVYNESKYISWSTYNTVFVFLFTTVVRFIIERTTNPDILYTIEFIRVHVSATTMLTLLLVPKAIMVYRYQDSTKDRANSCTSQHSSYRMHSGDDGFPLECPYEDENESLKTEIARLSSRLAVMRNICMKQDNIHIKPSKRDSQKCHIHYSSNLATHSHSHPHMRQGLLESCESGSDSHGFGRNGNLRDSPTTEVIPISECT